MESNKTTSDLDPLPLSQGGGRGGGRGGWGVRARRRAALALALAITLLSPYLWFVFLSWVFPFPWENLERPPAVIVSDRTDAPLRFFLPSDERWRFPVRLSELPPEVPRALVASEDQRFYRHFGVDPLAVLRA